MDWEGLYQKVENVAGKMNNYLEKEIERKVNETKRELSRRTDDELIRISKNPNLAEFRRELLEEEMQKRGIR